MRPGAVVRVALASMIAVVARVLLKEPRSAHRASDNAPSQARPDGTETANPVTENARDGRTERARRERRRSSMGALILGAPAITRSCRPSPTHARSAHPIGSTTAAPTPHISTSPGRGACTREPAECDKKRPCATAACHLASAGPVHLVCTRKRPRPRRSGAPLPSTWHILGGR